MMVERGRRRAVTEANGRVGTRPSPERAKAAVVAIEMGYGHLRPARTLARELGVEVMHTDRAPLADTEEQRRWQTTRGFYETMSRVSGLPWVVSPLRALVNAVTHFPNLYPFRDLSNAHLVAQFLELPAPPALGPSI